MPVRPHPYAKPVLAVTRGSPGEVEFELLKLAYARLPLSLLMTGVVTTVFVGMMSFVFPLVVMATWFGAIMLCVTVRYGLWRVYRHLQPGPADMRKWQINFLLGSAITGAAWTSGPVLIVLRGEVEGVSLLAATLLSVCAVAMNTHAPQRQAMQAFITIALLPFALAVSLGGEPLNLLLAFVLLAGMASLLLVGGASSKAMHKLIETQINLGATAAEADAARARAESASMAKTRFLANMSHELRTPLNAVIGAAQLLRAERAGPGQDPQLVDAIQRSGSNLLALIENILDISRIEAGELALRPLDFHLVECIDSALASAGLAAQAKGLRLACIVSTDLPAWRHGDADRLRQVVMNLLGNAVKFTERGDITVRVEPGGPPHSVHISVSDTGVGIAPQALAHVFEPFRQGDEGAARRYGGSGLGLAIVHQLVQALGGQISVTSQPGRGSCFALQLPLPPAAVAPDAPQALRLEVVLYEPHGPSAEALLAHLQRLGCRVQHCHGAAQARNALAGLGGAQPWLLLSADAPEHEALLDAVVDLIEPAHLIVMVDRTAYDADRVRESLHLQRQLTRPVTRAALVSRISGDPDTRPAVLQPPDGLLTARQRESLTHVLVVEDDELNRTIVSRLLQHGGYRVSVAGNGQEALQALRQSTRIDLVLMDWQMPDMDGLEVTRRLRAGQAGDAGRSVPIVALTANAFAEDRDACLAAGMNDFLSKPVQATSLMAKAQRWARGAAPPVGVDRSGTATRPAATPPVFDPSVLAALPMVADGSDPGYAQELLAMFMDGSSAALDAIRQATAAHETATVLRLVHTLKSSSATLGALELAALAQRHEGQLRQGAAPAADLPQQLGDALQRLQLALARHLPVAAQTSA